jgi:hypothetical protein
MQIQNSFYVAALLGMTALPGLSVAALYVPIDPPNCVYTAPSAVNSKGDSAGICVTDKGVHQGFHRSASGALITFNVKNTDQFQTIFMNEVLVGGYYVDSGGYLHGFNFDPASGVSTYDFPKATNTVPLSVNGKGTVGGYYLDASNNVHGFLRSSGGKFKPVDYPGAALTRVMDLNDNQQLTGWFRDAQNLTHGFILSSGKFTSIDPPDSVFTRPLHIDANGNVMGIFTNSKDRHLAFLRKADGTYNVIKPPRSSYADAKNFVLGTGVAGMMQILQDSGSDSKARMASYVYESNGKNYTIDVPGADWTRILNSNSSGFVIGTYKQGDVYHGFMTQLSSTETLCGPESCK